MDRRIASPELVNDPAARQLISVLDEVVKELNVNSATFYYSFPLFRDESNKLYKSKSLLISKSHGVVLFNVVGEVGRDLSTLHKADDDLTQLDSILFGKFLRSTTLRKSKRDIHVNINSCIYCMSVSDDLDRTDIDSTILVTKEDLSNFLETARQEELSDSQWADLTALLEGTKAITRFGERDSTSIAEDSKAMALLRIEDKIATFDAEQRNAAISVVNGPQRIRGIAGSGKTIVIAMRAAILHLNNPEAMILVTFWTKSLYDMLKNLITRFYRQFDDKDPNWGNIQILHAWGGRSAAGVYYNSCIENGVRPQTFTEIVPKAKNSKFEQACLNLVSTTNISQKYEYVLIDEGQDLPGAFYNLCFRVCKGGPEDRNIIWAYDELQTIMEVQAQDVTKTFGVDPNGRPIIDLDRASRNYSHGLLPHDIVLKKSYRNPPEILMCAHALGLGIYSEKPVQILEDKQHWEDLGYEVVKGNCAPGEATTITRPEENSPLNLHDFVPQADIILCAQFDEFNKELDWIVNEILDFIKEGLLPHDILVISLDDRASKSYFGGIAERLSAHDIRVNNLQNSAYSVPKFFIEDHVSVSTVYKAKGNEAAVVIVTGVDALYPALHDKRIRNKIFTAFTRSRAWLRVSGMGLQAGAIISEIETAIQNHPNFNFIYPDPREIETIQRDLSEKSVKLREMQQIMLDLQLTDDEIDSFTKSIKKDTRKA